MVPGRENLQPDAAACRASCAEDPGCTAWLWCARPGGCDDGQVRVIHRVFVGTQLYSAHLLHLQAVYSCGYCMISKLRLFAHLHNSLDSQDFVPDARPHTACDLLDAPVHAPLAEAARGPLFSSFAMGFMHSASASDSPSAIPREPTLHAYKAISTGPCAHWRPDQAKHHHVRPFVF